MREIKKVLIANRGEIAVRIIRTLQMRAIKSVTIFSDADKNAYHVDFADEAIAIGGNTPSESYLNQDKIIAAAKQSGADAIHPGYGFLSENASFAARCRKEGIIFIGPSPEVIEQLGSKAAAKEIMRNAGVPVVPGYEGDDQSVGRFKYEAGEIGFPVLLKASAGGGGRGMRIVNNEADLENAIEAAAREAEKSFGDGRLLMEKYFPKAKHIEFQIFGDEHGNYIHLGERECSLQRRHQKVIEEAPSPSLTPELRAEMGQAALAVAKAVNYTNAGTVEFLLDDDHNFYFLEVNTRLQVEHPVTEFTMGTDLVSWQIDAVQGIPIAVKQEDVEAFGHAIECRICAEDPEDSFLPSTGKILLWNEAPPSLKIRYDSGVTTGSTVSVHYDSMLAKVIAFGHDRKSALAEMLYALDNTVAMGITTNIDFLKDLIRHPSFQDGSFHTRTIETNFANYNRQPTTQHLHESAIAAMLHAWDSRAIEQNFSSSLNGWRNVFYQPQQFSVDYKSQTLDVKYRILGRNNFEVTVENATYNIELIKASQHVLSFTVNNRLLYFYVAAHSNNYYIHHPQAGVLHFKKLPRFTEPGNNCDKDGYVSPMPGEIVKVLVQPGEKVKSGQRLLVMNSMKMDIAIEATKDGVVEEVLVAEKSFVEAQTVLLKVT
ncbi:MAG: acetyl-CoA carboxylase biotin carboxylase subunit [Chitinophagales bacterium]|nr:acetyl-CoA carboxylase biotin carboxylase subunit [Chitinophagales bacterium]